MGIQHDNNSTDTRNNLERITAPLNDGNISKVHNSKFRDNAAKLVFGDPILCAQFLRSYTGLDILKDVRPEDLEDISTDREEGFSNDV